MSHQMMLENASLVYMFVTALIMAFSHCFAMCGGIVLAYSQVKRSFFTSIFSHLLYSLGRISTYVVLGVVCAYIGNKIAISIPSKAGIFILVGIFITLVGIGYLFLPKILFFLEPNIGNIGVFRAFFNFIFKRRSLWGIYILGILNGLLPCGMVYTFAASAAISGSMLEGAKIMLIFGVATLVPMFLLGICSSLLIITRYKNIISKISSILIIFFGIYTISKGFRILFS